MRYGEQNSTEAEKAYCRRSHQLAVVAETAARETFTDRQSEAASLYAFLFHWTCHSTGAASVGLVATSPLEPILQEAIQQGC